MSKLVWKNILRLVVLMLAQLLVFNYVYLGSYIMPMIYVIFILMLPTGMKRIPLLLLAFATGLIYDISTGVLGFHALACTVLAMERILFADRILTRGEPIVVERPTIYTATPQYFVSYLLLMYASFYLVLFVTELFGSRGFGDVLLATILSSLVSTILAVLYQWIFIKKEES